jgi:uncharacterized DUF497 family protein
MKIRGFEWDEGNVLHLELKHGITPQEAEEVFAISPLFKKTRKGHYAVFGRTKSGRLLVVVFETKSNQFARVIAARDMERAERRYYSQKKG